MKICRMINYEELPFSCAAVLHLQRPDRVVLRFPWDLHALLLPPPHTLLARTRHHLALSLVRVASPVTSRRPLFSLALDWSSAVSRSMFSLVISLTLLINISLPMTDFASLSSGLFAPFRVFLAVTRYCCCGTESSLTILSKFFPVSDF